jgi:putative transcriptional regulator
MIPFIMSVIKTIRTKLGMSQADLGAALGVTQGNVGHYERRGQLVSVPVAAKLIQVCEKRGLKVTFDDLYRHYLRRAPRRAASAPVAATAARERGPRTRPKASG